MLRLMAFLPRAAIILGTGLVLLSASSSLAAPASPMDSPESRATLKRIKAVSVMVEWIDPEVEREGLTRDQLQSDVEMRLRKAGIPVVPSAGESLHITVQPMKHSADLYAYAIHVALHQRVKLSRDSNIVASAPTWGVGCIGTVRPDDLRNVRASLADDVDKFIAAYREQNPKQ
jgi:hypothetical protein